MKGLKTGGRQPGSLNKATQNIKDAYLQLLENNLDKLQEDIDSLRPVDRLRFMLDLSEYVVPKLARTEAHTIFENKVSEQIASMTPEELRAKTLALLEKIKSSNERELNPIKGFAT